MLVTGPDRLGQDDHAVRRAARASTRRTRNIMTVEDPIEYELAGIGQTQVNPHIDLTFAQALRAILRQDPDVIMIGEIRDLETAQIAIQASLTGHLVLADAAHQRRAGARRRACSTWASSPSCSSRSLIGVLAQRLVRKLCPRVRERVSRPTASELRRVRASRPTPRRRCIARGCRLPGRHAGYRGRTGIYELVGSTKRCDG